MFIYLLASCQKSKVDKIKVSSFIADTIRLNKFTNDSIVKRFASFSDSIAANYYELYNNEFKPRINASSEFPIHFKIHKNIMSKIESISGSQDIHFILTSHNNKLDIIFASDSLKEKYLVTNRVVPEKIEDSTFNKMDSIFNKKLYYKMNQIKSKLTRINGNGNSRYDNTKDIYIPNAEFKNYKNDSNNFTVFYPGIISENKINSLGISKKYHLTLIMTVSTMRYKSFSDIYYDDFCLKPPGC